MRTSLKEIEYIESFLRDELTVNEKQDVAARMQTEIHFRIQVYLQAKVHRLVKAFHRKNNKAHMEEFHRNLFSDVSKSGYQNEIFQLFK